MNRLSLWALGLGASAVLAGAGYAVYALGVRHGSSRGPQQGAAPVVQIAPPVQPVPQGIAQGEAATRRHLSTGLKAGDVDPMVGRKVLYYHDPMVPGNQFEQPGKSPFMDMMLVPVYADAGAGAQAADADGGVAVSPRIQQSLGVRTAPVVEGALAPVLHAVGAIAWNERAQWVVQARAAAFVERLQVRAALDRVVQGQVLAELYVPEWVAAQEEYLSVRRMRGPDLASLVDGARARMRQVGMDEEQIALVERSAQVQARTTLVAPQGGVVTELAAREGMAVAAGSMLFRIQGTTTVWAHAEVPESQAALLRPGAKVRASSAAVPGQVFEGRVQAVLPEVNTSTRTLKARLELANPGARLVPGMFVQMQFTPARAAKALLVPTEAVIQTGQRTLVMLAQDGGHFRAVAVETGTEADGQTEIRRGLQAGQRVVVSGQFLIDSEASLRGVLARLNGAAPPPAVALEGSQP